MIESIIAQILLIKCPSLYHTWKQVTEMIYFSSLLFDLFVEDVQPDWKKYLEIVEIKDKGRGYRAHCDIPSMTCIMHDTSIISPSFSEGTHTSCNERFPSNIMEPLVVQLLENQEIFNLLSPQTTTGHFSEEVSCNSSLYSNKMWQLAYDKVQRNLTIKQSPDSTVFNLRQCLVLPLKISLFNHSCRPDVVIYSIHNTNIQKVETVRDIHKGMEYSCVIYIHCEYHLNLKISIFSGEEVCISYIHDGYLPSTERQRLLNEFGFKCQCERCSTQSGFEKDALMTADVNLSQISDVTLAPLREKYEQLINDLQLVFGQNTSRACSFWIGQAEQWLVDAWKKPYQLNKFHWLCVHMYKALRNRYKIVFQNGIGDNAMACKKILFFDKLIIQAESAVLQPLDPEKKGVDTFLDDWNDMNMPTNEALKVLQKLEPNAEQIIKRTKA